jgi:hypothetical protein
MASHHTEAIGLLTAFTLIGSTGCDSPSPTATTDAGVGSAVLTDQKTANPPFAASAFVASIDNPYLPLVRGTAFHYRSETEDGVETEDVVVTRGSKRILDVEVTVVHDQVFLDGELAEDTFDWFAQDTEGNVWYFGENTTEFHNGKRDTSGSFEAGVNGADAGIAMLAHPEAGQTYREEYYAGHAEDRSRVLALDQQAEVPFGHFGDVLLTEDYTPIEPDVLELKFYAKGIGQVLAQTVSGGSEREELISYTH